MPHTYSAALVKTLGTTTTVEGTVDGVSVAISFPSQVFASTLAFQAFIQPLMLAAAALPDATKVGTFIL